MFLFVKGILKKQSITHTHAHTLHTTFYYFKKFVLKKDKVFIGIITVFYDYFIKEATASHQMNERNVVAHVEHVKRAKLFNASMYHC